MRFAVVFNKDLDAQLQDEFIPLDWPMYLTALKPNEFPRGGVAVLTLDELNELKRQLEPAYIEMQEQKQNYLATNKLRVTDLVSYEFRGLSPAKLDFTIHLKENICLIKKVDMRSNGRPLSSKYYYPTVASENLIAQIDFEFIDNPIKFMIDRKEKLKYFKINGDFVGPFLIHRRTYDFGNLKEATESIQERCAARRNIIDEVKVFLNGFIVARAMLMGKTQLQANIEAITIGGIFMRIKNDVITAFIETASPDLRNFLINEPATGNYEFLDWYVQAGVRVRDYFVNRISY